MADYYQILSVPSGADSKKIKQAYRELAFQYHPDRNNENPAAVEKMKRINEAYAVLSDMQKRREYDTMRQQFGSSARHRFRQNYTEQDVFSGSDIHVILEEMAKSLSIRITRKRVVRMLIIIANGPRSLSLPYPRGCGTVRRFDWRAWARKERTADCRATCSLKYA